jgi:hypothetical protein
MTHVNFYVPVTQLMVNFSPDTDIWARIELPLFLEAVLQHKSPMFYLRHHDTSHFPDVDGRLHKGTWVFMCHFQYSTLKT